MSQAEFEAYLASLLKSLRVRRNLSADLADELRDHLETRLEELLAEGKTRRDAIRIALAEFDEPAMLAQKFSRLAKSRRRRFLMRCTAASSIVVAGVLLVAVSLMPPVSKGPGNPPVVAQQEEQTEKPQPEAIASSNPGEESVEQRAIAALDKKLSQAVEVNFNNVPLEDAVEEIANQIEADVLIDEAGIEEEGLSPDNTKVGLKFSHTPITARAALVFILEPRGFKFANRSGVIFVTTATKAEELLVVKVYNVRDLIERAVSTYKSMPLDAFGRPYGTGSGMGFSGGMGGGMGGMGGMGGGMGGGGLGGGMGGMGGGMYSVQDQITASALASGVGQLGEGAAGMADNGMKEAGMRGMGFQPSKPPKIAPEHIAMFVLSSLIQTSTSGPWVLQDGSGGSIDAFHGLLVIRQNEQVHNQVQKLLDGLREANENSPGGDMLAPKGKTPEKEQSNAESALREVSQSGDYEFTPDARAVLAGIEADDSGTITQLEVLRAVTLVKLPSHQTFIAFYVMDPMGVEWQSWQESIRWAEADDQPLGDLKTFFNAAQKHAGDKPIDAKHLLMALLENQDGPIPAVVANVGLTAPGLVDQILGRNKPSEDDLYAAPKEESSPPTEESSPPPLNPVPVY